MFHKVNEQVISFQQKLMLRASYLQSTVFMNLQMLGDFFKV